MLTVDILTPLFAPILQSFEDCVDAPPPSSSRKVDGVEEVELAAIWL